MHCLQCRLSYRLEWETVARWRIVRIVLQNDAVCTTCLPKFVGNGTAVCNPCVGDCNTCSIADNVCDSCLDA